MFNRPLSECILGRISDAIWPCHFSLEMRRGKIVEKFKREYKAQCLEIIDELFSHPISEVFQEPVDPIADEVPDYLDIIQNPSDLSTVRNKLLTDQYQTLQDFKDDVNLIWDNAIAYNGRSSLPAYIAIELSRIFRRRFSVLEEPSADQWINDYLKARSIMCRLFRTAPKGLASFGFGQESVPEHPPATKRYKVSDEDYELFQSVSDRFKDPALQTKLIQIITENEPGIDMSGNTLSLDLTLLSPRTMRLLKTWILELKEAKK